MSCNGQPRPAANKVVNTKISALFTLSQFCSDLLCSAPIVAAFTAAAAGLLQQANAINPLTQGGWGGAVLHSTYSQLAKCPTAELSHMLDWPTTLPSLAATVAASCELLLLLLVVAVMHLQLILLLACG